MSQLQRRLLIGVVLVTLVALALTVASLARGGRADPPGLRAQATLLNGDWRFRTGDDPRWADPAMDDKAWETISLTARPGSHDGDVGLPDYVDGWMAHGHPGYTGYAWYRRTVDVPTSSASWDVLGPTLVEDGYELYWNGRKLGGSGRIGARPRLVGTRPMRFALPAGAAGSRGVLAVRVFELRRPTAGTTGGGLHTPPILAPRPVGQALHQVQWERTIAGYIADAVEPVLMFALAGLALWLRPRSGQRGFLLWAAVALALTAMRRLDNALVSWTDVMDLKTYSFLAKYLWAPAAAAWALAWNRWGGRPWRAIDVAAGVIMAVEIVGVAIKAEGLNTAGRFADIALFLVIAARIGRHGPARGLALSVLGLIVLGFFGGELLDPLHVPGIWFPFGIGVSRTQYIYAVFAPLLAVLMVWGLGSARESDRIANRQSASQPSA